MGPTGGWASAVLAAIALSACGASSVSDPQPRTAPTIPPLQGVLASAQVVAGANQRVSFGILDQNNVPVPDATVTVQIFTLPAPGSGSPQPVSPVQPAPYKGDLMQGKGVYVVHQTLAPGIYNAVLDARKGPLSSTTTVALQVVATDPTPAVGSPAPRTNNPTSDQVADITTIDTGVPPDDMHYISIAGAIGAHHPVVVYFGSPGFCISATCGPQVDVVKALEASYRSRGIDFVHIETYKGGRPDAAKTTSQWFDEWKLQSDPWIFVVDSAGSIAAKFDGPTTVDEVEPALGAIVGPR